MRTLTLPKRGWQNIIIRLAMCQASGTGHRQIDSTYGGIIAQGGYGSVNRRGSPYLVRGRLPYPVRGRLPYPVRGRLPYPVRGRLPYPVRGRLPCRSTGHAFVRLRTGAEGRGGGVVGCWWGRAGRAGGGLLVVGGEGREGRGRDGEVFGWEGWGGSQASGVDGVVEGEGGRG